MLLHFNSIKVQLEPETGSKPNLSNSFQFHKGTIRTVWQDNSVLLHVYFNSIKVQLEPRKAEQSGESYSFQFHKGTIRTIVMLTFELSLLHFNSIKVQLEHISNETFTHYS